MRFFNSARRSNNWRSRKLHQGWLVKGATSRSGSLYSTIGEEMKTRKLLFAFLLTIIMVITTCAPVLADSSIGQFRVPVDQTQILSVCGFPILRHDEGMLIFQDSFDANGNVLWENAIFSNWRITFTNPANNKSLTSVRAYNERFVLSDDGSFKVMSAGLVAELVVPGEGQIAANVGVITAIFDSSGNLGSVLVAGEHDGAITQFVCPYLT
jgi:hypothetical protein